MDEQQTDFRGPVTRGIEEAQVWDSSPFIRGLISGTKGALLAAPIAAAVQALRGRDPLLGGILAALGTGALLGTSRALEQKVKNQEIEGQIRYHAEQLKNREPLFFLPPPNQFGRLFSRLHSAEHLRMLQSAHPKK